MWYLIFIGLFLVLVFIGEYLVRLLLAAVSLKRIKFKLGKNLGWTGHLRSIQSGECPFEFSKIRGSEKTVKALRGTHPVVITADPELIKNVCTKYAGYFHSRMIEPLAPDSFSADNVHVFGARGDRWKRIRTLTSFALKTSSLKLFLSIINEQTVDFISYLREAIESKKSDDCNNNTQAHGIELNAHHLFQKLTATVIGRSALGLDKMPFLNDSTHYKCFKAAFGDEPRVAMNSESSQWLMPLMTRLYGHVQHAFSSSGKSPIDVLNDFIESNLASKAVGADKVDFLQQFKNVQNPGFNHSKMCSKTGNDSYQDIARIKVENVMSTQEIISQTRFLSIAGFDTTANTLTFALLLLAENRDKMQLLVDEIDQFPDEFTYEDLSKPKYLHCVVLETLRLFPHASMLQSRLCMQDCQMSDGTFIPKNTGVLFDTWGMHQDPDYWGPDAREFVPERHANSQSFPDFYTPFGSGQRQCVGMRFGLMEVKAVMIQFLKEFTVTLPEGVSPKNVRISLRDTGTVWPYDVRFNFQLRSSCARV